jgi:hypothetical protein
VHADTKIVEMVLHAVTTHRPGQKSGVRMKEYQLGKSSRKDRTLICESERDLLQVGSSPELSQICSIGYTRLSSPTLCTHT